MFRATQFELALLSVMNERYRRDESYGTISTNGTGRDSHMYVHLIFFLLLMMREQEYHKISLKSLQNM